jgi:hypothetical protein
LHPAAEVEFSPQRHREVQLSQILRRVRQDPADGAVLVGLLQGVAGRRFQPAGGTAVDFELQTRGFNRSGVLILDESVRER